MTYYMNVSGLLSELFRHLVIFRMTDSLKAEDTSDNEAMIDETKEPN